MGTYDMKWKTSSYKIAWNDLLVVIVHILMLYSRLSSFLNCPTRRASVEQTNCERLGLLLHCSELFKRFKIEHYELTNIIYYMNSQSLVERIKRLSELLEIIQSLAEFQVWMFHIEQNRQDGLSGASIVYYLQEQEEQGCKQWWFAENVKLCFWCINLFREEYVIESIVCDNLRCFVILDHFEEKDETVTISWLKRKNSAMKYCDLTRYMNLSHRVYRIHLAPKSRALRLVLP